MKTITVDFSSSKPVQPFYGGEEGENRAVTLDIIPSTDMSEDEDIAIYYVAFTVEGGIILSETFNQGEDISISLGSVITEQRKVFFQLIATSSDGESVISKSPIVQLFLGKSITGEIIPDPVTGDTIYTEIARLVEAAEHIDLSDYYTKTEVDGIISPIEAELDDHETRIADLENADTGMVEIVLGQGGMSKFTATEIGVMQKDRITMCYKGNPISSILVMKLAGGQSIAYLGILYATGQGQVSAEILTIDDTKRITERDGGSMLSDAMRSKLNGIEEQAQVNDIETIATADGTDLPISNKKVTLPAFILNTANNLTNYYLKSETYDKATIDSLIGSISTLSFEVVQTLPVTDIQTNVIYLVPKSSAGTNDGYDEYIYINRNWELIGSTDIDLTDYYTKEEVDELIEDLPGQSLTDEQIISVCSIIADFITDGTNIIGVDSITALAL